MRFFLRCWIPALLSIGCVSQAQKNCAAEAKLLLVASQTKTAVTALNAGKKRTVQIYFFDTSSLNLMSQGVILRLRRGAAADLTVKLRLPKEMKTDGIPGRNERYKCEDDVIGGVPVRSYSMQTKFAGPLAPRGSEIFGSLSAAQKQLLQQAQVSIDWTQLKRIADIKSTVWQIKGQPRFTNLTLELWEWSAGEVLELSTKVGVDAAPSTYAQLAHLASTNGLSLSSNQTSKTALVFESVAHMPTH